MIGRQEATFFIIIHTMKQVNKKQRTDRSSQKQFHHQYHLLVSKAF